MARRRSRKTAKKLPPTELTIFCEVSEAGTYVADVAKLLSQINRKTFRQGYQYAVQSVEFYAPALDVIVGRLPHSWVSVNAWTKSMALWKQQQDDRLAESGLSQTVASHRDFKIYIDADHVDGNYTELQPTTVATGGPASQAYRTLASAQAVSPTVTMDWDKSQIVIPNKAVPGNTVEYYCHMLGDDSTGGTASFGMIKAYADSRNRPMQTDPNIVDVASGGIFGEMFDVDEATGDIVTNAQEHNTATPYLNDIDTPFEFYPGGSNNATGLTIVDLLSIQAGNRTLSSSVCGPFFANCGLILFTLSAACSMKITLAPGEYKGVMARPMQDVN